MPTTAVLNDRITRIATKVREKAIRLNPPLSEDAVLRFESEHGISLPGGYRAFLIHIGNGGQGPTEYGWAALGDAADDMRGNEFSVWTELPYLSQLFPFTKPWVWENDEVSDEGIETQINHGCIYVGNDGCGAYWFLIVTGAERGNMWMICGEGMQPTSPKRDFLQWFEDWLDGPPEAGT